MTREEVKALLGDISKEQLDGIMALNGKDIEKTKVTAQAQIDELNSQLTLAKDTLKEFEGVDVKDLQGKLATLNTEMATKETEYQTKLADMEFNSQLEGTITALGAKNTKAVRALLDLDNLKQSKNQGEDIKKALDGIKADNDYLFSSDEPIKNPVKDTGNTNIVDTSSSLRIAMGLPAETK